MLYSLAGTASAVRPRTYLKEVQEVGDAGLEFHIANRNEDITRLARQIAFAEKPNFAIIGPPGTGKSLVLDYIINVITGEIQLPKKHEWYALFETIKQKVRQFQTRDYLFLPNLQDPCRPIVLDYINGEIAGAKDVAESFCDDVVRIFEGIGSEAKIRPQFEPEEFKTYVTVALRHIYESLHRGLDEIIDVPARFYFDITPAYNGFNLGPPKFLDKVSWDSVRSGLGIRLYRRYIDKSGKVKRRKRKVKIKEIKESLKKELRTEIKGDAIKLLSIVEDADVTGLDLAQKRRILRASLEEVSEKFDEAAEVYSESGLGPYFAVLRRQKAPQLPALELSPKSWDWLGSRLEGAYKANAKNAPENLRQWMQSTVRYFKEYPKTVSNEILNHYLKAHGERVIKKGNKITKLVTSHPYAVVEELKFCLPHGGESLSLKKILSPKEFLLSKSGIICVKKPKSFTEEEMWGRIGKPDKNDDENDYEDDGDDEASRRVPPHAQFTPGYLMGASIIVLEDDMQAFFKALIGSEVQDAAVKRQTILTFVEEGKLVVEKDGKTFETYSPTMIVGCGNENPFLKFSEFFTDQYDFDEAMYSRFTVYYWDKFTQNTAEARAQTIKLINSAVAKFNEEKETNLCLSDEVKDHLLLEWSYPDLLDLDYRRLCHRRIRDLLGLTRMRGGELCTLEDVIQSEREQEPKDVYHHIDNRAYSMISKLPEKLEGQVFGVVLKGDECSDHLLGDLMPIRSAVVLDLPLGSRNFQQYNIDTKLAKKDTNKGFREAVDYVLRQIGQPIRFTSKTTFHREFEVAGDSASLAMAIAISSALGKRPIHSNIAYTGNLSFMDGTVGPVGSVYAKARTVWRANQKLKPESRMRFIFPGENFRELKEKLIISPHPIADEIDLIPVTKFSEAFYLGAVNPKKIDTKNLAKIADEFWRATLKKVRTNVRAWNRKVLTAYGKKAVQSIST